MKICLIKQLDNSFKIAYPSDYDVAKKLKAGEPFFFEVKKSRNIGFHRKFFSLLNLIYNNQTIYTNMEDLRHDLTIAAGYYTLVVNIQGEEIKRAKSISFTSMDELAFNAYYDAVVIQVMHYLNVTKEQIKENVMRYY